MPILNSPILSGDISGTVYATRIEKLKGYPISVVTPAINQALVFDGSQWAPSTVAAGNGGTNVVLMTASVNQTVFTFLSSFSYAPGTNNLAVYRNGLRLVASKDYTETNPTTVTLVQPVAVGSEIVFEAGRIITQGMALTAQIGTFTSYVSAPSVYGKFYGDGSGLTGLSSTDPTKLSLTGGTLTGALVGQAATFTSVSAVALSGTHFGDGSKLTGVLASGGTPTFTSVSAVALSGTHFGDGSKLTGILTLDAAGSKYFTLSGGTINGNSKIAGNLTVYGDLSSTGTQTFANTLFVTTSALSVVNIGTGAALYVGNSGTGDIASFYDIDQNVEVLHVGGNNGTFPNVGVKTSSPNKTFTVNGEISASSDIWTGGKFRGDGSLLTGIVASGGTPTFTSVSAVALSGTHFGDGSKLTGIFIPTISTSTPTGGVEGDIWFQY